MFDQRLKLTRMVLWQSFCYVLAFYVTLPVVLLSFYIQFTTRSHYWLLFTTAALAPLQGMMNAIVYFQRSRGGLRSSLRSSLSMVFSLGSGVGRRRRQISTDSHKLSWSRSQDALETNAGPPPEIVERRPTTDDGNVRAHGSIPARTIVAELDEEEDLAVMSMGYQESTVGRGAVSLRGDLDASSQELFLQSAVAEHWRLNEGNWSS